MSKNPFVNALFASGYISILVMFFSYARGFDVDNLGMIVPITFLSLFVFSAALMGYFFVYQPVLLLIEGKKEEATKFFLTTVASFAGITGTLILSWLLLSSVLPLVF